MVFKFLAINVATMLAVSLVYGMIISSKRRDYAFFKILHGIFFAIAGLIVMINSYQFQTGIIFDCRTVIMGAIGMFCGPLSTSIAIIITAGFRILEGGSGTIMGILTISSSGIIGIIFYYLKQTRPYLTNTIFLYLFGLIIHTVMIILMLTLPWPTVIDVFKTIALPVLVLFPLATVMLCKMLDDQEQKLQAKQKIEQYNAYLHESQRHLQRAVKDCPFPIMIHAEDGEIIHVSKIWQELTGYDMNEIKTVSQWTEKAYITDRIAVESEIKSLYQLSSRKYEGDFNIVTKDGRIIVWEFYTVPLGTLPDGRRIVMSAATDLTQRINIENELRDAKERTDDINRYLELETLFANKMASNAQSANIAKSQFLANMSHEIRTPINAVVGFSEFLSEEPLTDKQKEYVNIIMDAGRNLLGLINDILDFSKIEAGEMSTENINCRLKDIFASVSNLITAKANEKGLEFKIIGRNLPDEIITDPSRLKQCLINLAGNAVKFTHSGYVHITAEPAELNERKYLRFDIEDTGIGISPDKQKIIFEPFRQADGSNTRQYGGTGLGLTITKQLAELLGGKISVKSTEGKGSVFTLLIPLVECDSPAADTVKNLPSQTNETTKQNTSTFKGRALVAEDAKTNQIFIRQLLEKLGLTVTMVEDGAAAVRAAVKDQFDIIFMDMLMPLMNGYDATANIRELGVNTPIIAVTANAMKGDDQKCLEAGCNDYISKPFRQSDLRDILNKHLKTGH